MSSLLMTCEHGGQKIPAAYRRSFTGSPLLLNSHRGWDPGALELARALKNELRLPVPFIFAEISRLLIDLNRGLEAPDLHSPFLRDSKLRQTLIDKVYLPYRKKVQEAVQALQPVIHFSIHSFTPIRRGEKRECEIGLLFDPKSSWEREICKNLKRELEKELPRARVRMNYPYKGSGDGQTTDLRKEFGERTYAGIEIEFNQGWLKRKSQSPKLLAPSIARAILRTSDFS